MKAISTEAGGAIFDDAKGWILPLSFDSQEVAQSFLDACERVGVCIYAGMPHSDLKSMFDLWFDGWKRPGQPR